MELYDLGNFRRKLESYKEMEFSSQFMKNAYGEYINSGERFCHVCEKLNNNLIKLKILCNDEKKHSNKVDTNIDFKMVDIEKVEDPNIRRFCETQLKLQEIFAEEINERNNFTDKIHEVEILVLDKLEQIIDITISMVMKEDYRDYSAIIDFINLAIDNIPVVSSIAGILCNISDFAKALNKLDNDRQKEIKLSSVDSELHNIEEKIKVFNATIISFKEFSKEIEKSILIKNINK